MRVIENRDGSLSTEAEFEGEDLSHSECCAAFAHFYLDRAEVHLRLAKMISENRGSARDQATNEIRAEEAMRKSDHWARHLKRKISRRVNGREIR